MNIKLFWSPNCNLAIFDAHPHAFSDFFIRKFVEYAITANYNKIALIGLQTEGTNFRNCNDYLWISTYCCDFGFQIPKSPAN